MLRSTIVLFGCLVLGALVTHASSPGSQLETVAGVATIHPIEHATFVLEWKGRTVAVDPVGGGDSFSGLPTPGLVLITHQHGDHLSVDTVEALADEATQIVVPPSVAERLPEAWQDRVTVLRNGERTSWHDILIEAIPAYNLTPDRLKFHPRGRDNGYVLGLGETRIYISGDTEDIPEMRALEDIDAAFLCMNLPYTMDVSAAASAVNEFRPKVVFPYHFRGQSGMSDIDRFRELVGEGSDSEVRLLEWY
jgi:L-ascorbate metabolism protein UlaG (beta-lactamase superfamily)